MNKFKKELRNKLHFQVLEWILISHMKLTPRTQTRQSRCKFKKLNSKCWNDTRSSNNGTRKSRRSGVWGQSTTDNKFWSGQRSTKRIYSEGRKCWVESENRSLMRLLQHMVKQITDSTIRINSILFHICIEQLSTLHSNFKLITHVGRIHVNRHN